MSPLRNICPTFSACARGSRQDPLATRPNPACQACDQRCSCRMDLHASKCWCTKEKWGGEGENQHPAPSAPLAHPSKNGLFQWMTAEVIQRQITTNSTHSKEHRWQLRNINNSTVLQSRKEIKEQKEGNPAEQQIHTERGLTWLTCFGGRSSPPFPTGQFYCDGGRMKKLRNPNQYKWTANMKPVSLYARFLVDHFRQPNEQKPRTNTGVVIKLSSGTS